MSGDDSHPAPSRPGGQRMVMVADQVLSLSDAPGATVACERGMLWITQHMDGGDFVLVAGQSFTVSRMGNTVLMAMTARTVVTVSAPAPEAQRASWLRSLFSAFGRFNAIEKGVMS
jgi:hypothetical protein